MLMSYYQKAGQKHSIKIAAKFFENVVKLKYLGTTVTDQKCICKEIKSRQFREYLLPFSSEPVFLPAV
jgi:hypothetical protein